MVEPSSFVSPSRRMLDRAGIGIAGLCALHCLATVAFVSGLSVGGHFLLDPMIHEVGLLVAIAVAAVAIGWGVLRHRRAEPLMVAALGLALMIGALAVGHGQAELLLTMTGVTLVGIGHLMNMVSARTD
jgi:hypothetical protein